MGRMRAGGGARPEVREARGRRVARPEVLSRPEVRGPIPYYMNVEMSNQRAKKGTALEAPFYAAWRATLWKPHSIGLADDLTGIVQGPPAQYSCGFPADTIFGSKKREI